MLVSYVDICKELQAAHQCFDVLLMKVEKMEARVDIITKYLDEVAEAVTALEEMDE